MIRSVRDAVSLLRQGRLGREQMWTAFRGAGVYLTRTRTDGSVFEVCRGCEHKTGLASGALYCGEPFTPTDRTCGCLIGVTVGGEEIAGGKTVTAGEACPDGRW
jgi:hypothetical protein